MTTHPHTAIRQRTIPARLWRNLSGLRRTPTALWRIVERLDTPGAQWAVGVRYFAVCLAIVLVLTGWYYWSLWVLLFVAAVRGK